LEGVQLRERVFDATFGIAEENRGSTRFTHSSIQHRFQLAFQGVQFLRDVFSGQLHFGSNVLQVIMPCV